MTHNCKRNFLNHRLFTLFSFLLFLNCLVGTYATNTLCNEELELLYDYKNQICCNNKVQNRLRGQECCGGTTFYFTNTSICCGTLVKNRYVSFVCPPKQVDCAKEDRVEEMCSPNDYNCQEQTCCGNDSVSKEDTMCCHGNKIVLTPSQRQERDYLYCCNKTSLFDIRSEVCCGNKKRSLEKDIACCGDIFYKKDIGNCLWFRNEKGEDEYTIGNKNEAICGDRKYNKNTNGCCLGVLNNVPEFNPEVPNLNELNPNFSCCDTLVMNPIEEKCCRSHHHPNFDTHTIPNKTDFKCCGNGFYNTSQDICYNGQVIEKKEDKLFCGGSYFDPKLNGCCGKQPYLKEREICCDGNLNITVMPKNFYCCNGVGISDDHLCCDDRVPLKKSHPGDDKCCYKGHDPVDTYTKSSDQRCINGAVVEGYTKGREPCGSRDLYDVTTEICCKGLVFTIQSKGDKCCGRKPYNSDTHQCCSDQVINTETQQCCEGAIFNISPKYSRCCFMDANVYELNDSNNPCIKNCSGILYDESYQVCCKGSVYNHEEDFSCCGRSYIDSSTMECCAGNAYSINTQHVCCGRFYVNKEKKSCCAAAYPYNVEGKLQCCGDRELYDTRWSQCNDNKVVSEFSDTQMFCLPKALKTFENIREHGCRRKFGFRALIGSAQIKRYPKLKTNIVELHLTRVRGLRNMPNIGSLQTLVLKVFLNKDNKIKCRQKNFPKMEIIVLLDHKTNRSTINVMANSKLFLSKYTVRTEKKISAAAQLCRLVKLKSTLSPWRYL